MKLPVVLRDPRGARRCCACSAPGAADRLGWSSAGSAFYVALALRVHRPDPGVGRRASTWAIVDARAVRLRHVEPRTPARVLGPLARRSRPSDAIRCRCSPSSLLALPALVALGVYRQHERRRSSRRSSRARSTRRRRPRSPSTTRRSTSINGENPFRALEKTTRRRSRSTSRTAGAIYYQNCVFCHGDSIGGDGMFVHGAEPDPDELHRPGHDRRCFQETFLFWRISKGGPGLPDEGGPWDSRDAGVGEVPDRRRDLGRRSSSSTTTPATGRAPRRRRSHE